MLEWPLYQSHKQVWALKIAQLDPHASEDGRVLMTPVEQGYALIWLDAAYVTKHQPKVGGYYVIDQDGYKSWSPADAFEQEYTLLGFKAR